jgi:TrpR-related protein YerC/YecD
MKNWHTESTDRLIHAIKSVETSEECYQLLEDLCTIKEIIDMSQRLEVAVLLSQDKKYQEIAKETGASTATISRVKKCLSYGSGGYLKALEDLKNSEE